MVKPNHELLKSGIKNTKMRIKHMEKHGKGTNAMQEKEILKRQERRAELLRQKGFKI